MHELKYNYKVSITLDIYLLRYKDEQKIYVNEFLCAIQVATLLKFNACWQNVITLERCSSKLKHWLQKARFSDFDYYEESCFQTVRKVTQKHITGKMDWRDSNAIQRNNTERHLFCPVICFLGTYDELRSKCPMRFLNPDRVLRIASSKLLACR